MADHTAPTSTVAPASVSTTGDVVRQVTVLIGAVLATVAAFLGSGAGGGSQVGDGALSADATPVAPGSGAFSIWSVIYTGLVLYAVWQALPAQREDGRQRRVGWLVLATMLLNALWIGVVQADLLPASLAVIAVLLVVLVVTMRRLVEAAPRGRAEAVVLDGTLGLYLGWVTVATIANTFAVVVAGGVDPRSHAADLAAVGALAVAAAAGVMYAVWTRGRLAIGAAIVWGLVWVAVARSTGDLQSTPAAVAAAGAAVIVFGATVASRLGAVGRSWPRGAGGSD